MNTTDLSPIPANPDVDQYRKQAKELLAALKAHEEEALRSVRQFHPHWKSFAGLDREFKLSDAQLMVARRNGLESWPKFLKFIDSVVQPHSQVSEFEEAADAVVRGDAAKLRAMLAANPGLVHAKSERVHNSQLIHYIGANGFENWRQKTPKNAPEMLRILLDAGAEVDAKADAYGRGTTLGLVATSVHPVNAGVQIQLMEMLIQAGADVNGAPGGWNIVISALHNGRGLAARYLADHGATLDLESVAGVGRLDLVRRSFSPGGSLKPPATPKQMSDGFMWACEYGWPEVVAFLLDQGTDISEGAGADMTGLHWAIVGNQIEVVRLLLARGAPLEALNVYGGTALDCAVWCVENQDPGPEFLELMHVLIDAGANREVYPGMAKDVDAAMERLARKKV